MDLDIDLTHKCNLRCRHCLRGAKKNGSTMSYDTIEKIAENVPFVDKLALSGGEIFEEEDLLLKTISLFRNKVREGITLRTNGIVLYNSYHIKDYSLLEKLNEFGHIYILFTGLSKWHREAGGLNRRQLESLKKKINMDFWRLKAILDGGDLKKVVPISRAKFLPTKDYDNELSCDYVKNGWDFYVIPNGKVFTCMWLRPIPVGDLKHEYAVDIRDRITAPNSYYDAIRRNGGLSELAHKLGLIDENVKCPQDCSKVYKLWKSQQ